MVDEEKSESDIFTAAFDNLAKTGELPPEIEAKVDEPVVEEKPVEGESDGAEEIPADATVSESDGAGEDTSKPAEVEADVQKKVEPISGSDQADKPKAVAPEQDIIDRLAQAVKDRTQEPAPQQPQSYEPPPVLTQEDYKQLEAFEKDWPDVAKAMDLRAKEQAHAIVNHIFKEFAQEFRPVAEQVMAMRQQMHVQQLKSNVSDYDDIREKVVEWANSQPDYLRGAYQHVIQHGTPEQVQDLINRYRAENAPPPAPAPVAPQPPKQLSPAVKKAAEKLAPVQSKRSNVVRGDDPNDYDGSFEQWAKMQ